jgi:inhibitor of KinA
MYPLGESSLVVQLGKNIDLQTHRKVQVLSAYLDENPFPGMIEYIPAFTTVTVFYDSLKIWQAGTNSPYEKVRGLLSTIIEQLKEKEQHQPKTVKIPVCYGGEFGPDLEEVARHNSMEPEEVINIHSQGEYLVYMVGFAPGFPYLGGLSKKIAAPRRDTPRLTIPIGTVGIAGMQTGVYPIESPGGWQLIGRTPLSLFRPKEEPPTLLQAGNIVKFFCISRKEYDEWEEG